MKFPTPLFPATLIKRYKRFLCDVRLESGETITAHCPNPGSMRSCLIPGGRIYLSKSHRPSRKLAYTWELAEVYGTWVGVNPLRANDIVEEALREEKIPEASGYVGIRREVRIGEKSRIDFLLEDREGGQLYLEVKCVTYVENGVALFPDAPTARGRRHLRDLIQIVGNGQRAAILFLIHRRDTQSFQAAREIDPMYADLLKQAEEQGVGVWVYDCIVERNGIWLREQVRLTPHNN